jgi:hypothetical protein
VTCCKDGSSATLAGENTCNPNVKKQPELYCCFMFLNTSTGFKLTLHRVLHLANLNENFLHCTNSRLHSLTTHAAIQHTYGNTDTATSIWILEWNCLILTFSNINQMSSNEKPHSPLVAGSKLLLLWTSEGDLHFSQEHIVCHSW